MGLDVSHGAFNGAYSAFHRLRVFMCKALGGSYPPHENKDLDRDKWYDSEMIKAHPSLSEFFSHSDCDGEISPETAGQLAADLYKLLPFFVAEAEKSPEPGGHLNGGYVAAIVQFAIGCRAASAANEPLEFY